jgi:bacterioferritin
MSNTFAINLSEIRRRARENLREGAFTDAYGHDREEVIRVLNTVLATEIVCTMRYRNNALVAQGIHAETAAAEFLEHAAEEESHANAVAKRIVQLGGVPDMNPATLAERSHADYFTSTNVQDLIRENLVAERIAIETYSALARWLGDKDPSTRRLIEELLSKEEEHAEDLATLLSR